MVSSAYQYSLCYYTSYISITLQVTSDKQFHCALIPKYINIKNNNNNMSKSSSLHSAVFKYLIQISWTLTALLLCQCAHAQQHKA